MGAQDKQKSTSSPSNPPQEPQPQESNQTLPLHSLQELSLQERPSNKTMVPQIKLQEYPFLKNKPIKKRNRPPADSKDKLRLKIERMENRIKELQDLLEDFKTKENSCPHCHFYQNSQPTPSRGSFMTPEQNRTISRCNSRQSLEFEQVNFTAPLTCSTEMEEKTWVFLGTIMIAMGSKVMDMDGTLNVFKIVKESVDNIRRQVQKSEDKLSMNFFLSKQEMVLQNQPNKIDELDFDPFYSKQEPAGGLQLDGVKVESVEEYDLFFDQKLCFNVKYDSLITAMEYLKENSHLSFN